MSTEKPKRTATESATPGDANQPNPGDPGFEQPKTDSPFSTIQNPEVDSAADGEKESSPTG